MTADELDDRTKQESTVSLRAPLRYRIALCLREHEPARALELEVAADEPHGDWTIWNDRLMLWFA